MIEGPPGSTGGLFGGHHPPDPNRTSQELVLTVDLGGGRDRTVDPEGRPLPAGEFGAQPGGYLGTAAAEIRYRRGRARRFVEGTGHAFTNRFETGVPQLTGGNATLSASTGLGRRSGLAFGLAAAYEPTLLFNAFGPEAGPVGAAAAPVQDATLGITEQQWRAGRASTSLFRNWTTHQRMDLQFEG
jgi:hypothetical protein